MEIIESIYIAIIALTTFFPVGYICYKKGNNKLFFLSSCLGVSCTVMLLLSIIVIPVAILMIKVIPQLAAYDQLHYILPLLYMADFIQEYYLLILYPVFMVVLPMLIFRRYPMFHLTKLST
jgi:hypothetical protein